MENIETEAEQLKIPVVLYSEIAKSPRLLYMLRKPMEGFTVLTLQEAKQYLNKKYGLCRASEKVFLKHSNRATQQGREIAYTYLYAQLVSQLFRAIESENLVHSNISLAIPKEDRGIDSYLRIVRPNDLIAIPIQICEIKNQAFSNTEEAIDYFYTTIRNAKLKPFSEQSNLLCVVSSDYEIATSVGQIRGQFEESGDQWGYDKILFMNVYSVGMIVYTVWLRNAGGESHFLLKQINGNFEYFGEKGNISI